MDEIKINKIVRSRRKTVALIVTPEVTLIVRAPLQAPLAYLQDIVRARSGWIRQKLLEVSSRPRPLAKTYVDGEEFLYLGKAYKLRILPEAARNIELKDNLYLAAKVLPIARRIILRWYKAEALRIITARCAFYQSIAPQAPAGIKISNARKRWGSCGARGTLNFCWRLIMAPMEIIDYLVVHELVHIAYLNHSPQYWQKVASIMPDYRRREKWLRENGGLLAI